MREYIKIAAIVLVASMATVVIAGLVGNNQLVLGGVTNYDSIEAAGIAIGSGCDNEASTCTGTTLTLIQAGTCSPVTVGSVTASTTAVFSCKGLTNIVSGDKVLAISADTQTAWNSHDGFTILATNATSTTGFDLLAENLTGAATTSVASLANLQYWIFR